MNKTEFLVSLDNALKTIPHTERISFLDYYDEMIEDNKENGFSEQEAVQKAGNPIYIAKEILRDNEELTIRLPSTGSKILNGILLVLGFPIWGTLILLLFALLFAVYFILWCIPFAMVALAVAMFAKSISSLSQLFIILQYNPLAGGFELGIGLALIGLAGILTVFTFEIYKKIIKATALLTTKIKKIVVKKGVR